tara:strand:+ start:3495 stop:4088 length:594 start_codon:yes stop_codon:yes gene_type:complete
MSVKKHIVDTMKQLYNKKYISIRDGNVSFKPKNENFFYISAGNIRKNEINEDQIIKVKFDQNLLLDYNKDHKYDPSREIYMHSLLQTDSEYFNKDTFVVHAHPPNIISYTGLYKSKQLSSIKEIFPELNVGKIGENVSYHEAGSMGLAKECYKNLFKNDIVALERHGSLSIGNDIEKIYENIETLEYYINISLNSKN